MWLFSFAAIPGAELVQLQVHFLQMQTDQLLTSRDPATNFRMLIYLLSMIFIYYLQKQFEVIIKYVFLDEDFDSILIFNLDSETLGGGEASSSQKKENQDANAFVKFLCVSSTTSSENIAMQNVSCPAM